MSPEQIVTQFLDRWNEGIDEVAAAFHDTFNQDTIYDNVGNVVTIGPEESAALVRESSKLAGFTRMGYDMVNVFAESSKVYTERVDIFYDGDDRQLASLRVMGIFEIDEAGKISAWRDYFDSRAMESFTPK